MASLTPSKGCPGKPLPADAGWVSLNPSKGCPGKPFPADAVEG
jgi:hypothetical protein